MAARIAMMAMTTSNSIRVNPLVRAFINYPPQKTEKEKNERLFRDASCASPMYGVGQGFLMCGLSPFRRRQRRAVEPASLVHVLDGVLPDRLSRCAAERSRSAAVPQGVASLRYV